MLCSRAVAVTGRAEIGIDDVSNSSTAPHPRTVT